MGLWALWGESLRGYRCVDVHIMAVVGCVNRFGKIQGSERVCVVRVVSVCGGEGVCVVSVCVVRVVSVCGW